MKGWHLILAIVLSLAAGYYLGYKYPQAAKSVGL